MSTPSSGRQEIEPWSLADRQNHGVTLDRRFAALLERRVEFSLRVEYRFCSDGLQSHHLAIATQHALRTSPVVQTDALDLCLFDFLGRCRHLFAPFQAHDADLSRAHPKCRERDVHHFARGDCGDVFVDRRRALQIDPVLLQHFANGGACHVHGDVSSADHDHFLGRC